MYAVIKTGGKQHRVSEGDVVVVERSTATRATAVVFDQVLMVENEGDIRIGRPVVDGAKVTGEILSRRSRQTHRIQDEEAQGVPQEERAPPAVDQHEDQGNIHLSGGQYGTQEGTGKLPNGRDSNSQRRGGEGLRAARKSRPGPSSFVRSEPYFIPATMSDWERIIPSFAKIDGT